MDIYRVGISILALIYLSACSNNEKMEFDPAIYQIDPEGVYMVGTSTDVVPNNYFRLDSARAYDVFPKDSTWFKKGLYDGLFYLKQGSFKFNKYNEEEFHNYSLGSQPISEKLNNSDLEIFVGNLLAQESSDIVIKSEGWYYVLFHKCCAFYVIPINSIELVGPAIGSSVNGGILTNSFSSRDSIQFVIEDIFLLGDKNFNFQINGEKLLENSLNTPSREAFSLELGRDFSIGDEIILDNLGKYISTEATSGRFNISITIRNSLKNKVKAKITRINSDLPDLIISEIDWKIKLYSENNSSLYSNDFYYLGFRDDAHTWVSIQSFDNVEKFQYRLKDQIIGPNEVKHLGNDIEDISRNNNYFTYNDPSYPYKFITISTRNYGENWDIQFDSLEWKIEGTVFGDTDSYHLFYVNNGWSLNFFRILQGEYRFIPNDEFDYSFGGVDTSYLFLNGPYLINVQENRVSGKLLPGDSLNHFRWNMRIL